MKALTEADKALQDQGRFSYPDWLLLCSRPHDPVTLLFSESASGHCLCCSSSLGHFLQDVPRATPSCKSVQTCLPIVAFLTIQSKMTTYPQHPLSPSTSSMPSNTVYYFSGLLSCLLEHKLHEGRVFILSTAGSLELRLVLSTCKRLYDEQINF